MHSHVRTNAVTNESSPGRHVWGPCPGSLGAEYGSFCTTQTRQRVLMQKKVNFHMRLQCTSQEKIPPVLREGCLKITHDAWGQMEDILAHV